MSFIKGGSRTKPHPFILKVFVSLRNSIANVLSWLVDKVCPNFGKPLINYLAQCICFIEVCTWVLCLRLILSVINYIKFFVEQLKIVFSFSGTSKFRKIMNNVKLIGYKNIWSIFRFPAARPRRSPSPVPPSLPPGLYVLCSSQKGLSPLIFLLKFK